MPEFAPRYRRSDRIEQGNFQADHIGGLLPYSPIALSTHNAAQALRAVLVGDHAHGLIECVCLAIQREHGLAGLSEPQRDIAFEFASVKKRVRVGSCRR